MIRKPPLGPDWTPVSARLLELANLASPEPRVAAPREQRAAAPAERRTAPGKRRGRPKAVRDKRLGQCLKAVAEISSRNKNLGSELSITDRLRKRPEYARLSERTLRRYVKSTLDWAMGILEAIPMDLWEEMLGISPLPQGATTTKALRAKALEMLRHKLQQGQLLAKKQ
jgi:hypothetical protein